MNDSVLISATDIAIIGMAGRFPGASDVDAFWANLRDGVESIRRYSDAELRARGATEAEIADPQYVKAGAPLDGVADFDAALFGYAPREAEEADPQHRLLLEASWSALEHAGYDGGAWDRPIGVYAGCGVNTYLLLNLMPSGRFADLRDISSLQGLMNGNNSMSTTVAYKLNLRGPAVTVQTACSTSLAAVHMACQALLAHEADMALAGGAWANLLHEAGYRHQSGAILSADGHCRAFDAAATGTVIGSGVGMVVLKRLADARADGDTVHAVIKASAMNNDGNAKVGYTAPSVAGQAEVIRLAHALAGISPDSISYVEAHGTGTTMGDPIEIAALTEAFRAGGARGVGSCAVGSVKSNVGHLDAAAGVAGLIKTALALSHRQLPPSLHFETPNPRIAFEGSPFAVNASLRDWPQGATPRRAGVSSFGIGGTNVHLVLEEAPAEAPAADAASPTSWQLLPLSARTSAALAAATAALDAHRQGPGRAQCLADVAHTLQRGRKRFAERAFTIADSETGEQALTWLTGRALATPSLAFTFPGQGAQHPQMARALYVGEPVFRAAFDRCADGLSRELGVDLAALIYGEDEALAAEQLAQTRLTQPALFAVEYALAQLWLSWGLRPSALLGHSIGEYVAAVLAGVFDLDAALSLVAARGRLLQACAPGAMLAVPLAEAALAPFLGGCDLAAVNGPERCVLAGPVEAIAAAEAALAACGIATQRLPVSHAFHSALVEPACAALRALFASIELRSPTIPMVSNVTGTWLSDAEATDPDYWARHLRGTVRFADGLALLLADRERVLLEVGPGETLTRLALAQLGGEAAAQPRALSSLPHPQRQAAAAAHQRQAVGRLWLLGLEPDWTALQGEGPRRRVPLPGYRFERQRYWVDARRPGGVQRRDDDPRRELEDWFYAPQWQRLPPESAPSADGLGSDGRCVVIGTAALVGPLIEALRARGRQPQRFETAHDAVTAIAADGAGPIGEIFDLSALHIGGAAYRASLGLAPLLALVQAVEARQPGRPLALTLAARGLADVLGDEAIDPRPAGLIAPLRVLPHELPHWRCALVDLDDASELGALIDAPAGFAALRRGHWWMQRFDRVALPAVETAGTVLRAEGSYLITGGLGGIGLVFAEQLARRARARLVLLGRRAPDAAQQQAIARLQQLGSEVLVVSADVADRSALEAALAQAQARFGALAGVIHAAGDAGGGLVLDKSPAEIARVLAPKVDGTDALLALLDGQALDFVMLCSSLATVAGGLGKLDYVAANAYLDLVAIEGRSRGLPLIAVGWDSWREVGMAGEMAMPDGVGIPPAAGAAALERILAAPRAQLIVSTLDLATRLDARGDQLLAQALALGGAGEDARGTGHARPALAVPFVAPAGELEPAIADIWSRLLGITEIGAHDNLFELGGDSLLGIQILSRLRERYAIELAPAAFFKDPTVAALAATIEARLLDEVEAEDA